MFSSEYEGYQGEHTVNHSDTSYTFGPHHARRGKYIMYALDTRVVRQDPQTMPAYVSSAPAWVIADLMLSAHRGQPLTAAEQALTAGPFVGESLQWLQRALVDLSK